MMGFWADLSVIVPVGKGDRAWKALLDDLATLPAETEVLFVAADDGDFKELQSQAATWIPATVRCVGSPPGRARQLNAGALASTRSFLWFVHADTRLDRDALEVLARAMVASPDALHYFDLRFRSDGPAWMRLNEVGVRVRSHWMGMPFGDQGFCVSREVYERVGGFPEDVPYGEDHVFVWRARQKGVRLRCTGVTIATSARKYAQRGWVQTTAKHFVLTYKQAIPEFLRWVGVMRD